MFFFCTHIFCRCGLSFFHTQKVLVIPSCFVIIAKGSISSHAVRKCGELLVPPLHRLLQLTKNVYISLDESDLWIIAAPEQRVMSLSHLPLLHLNTSSNHFYRRMFAMLKSYLNRFSSPPTEAQKE